MVMYFRYPYMSHDMSIQNIDVFIVLIQVHADQPMGQAYFDWLLIAMKMISVDNISKYCIWQAKQLTDVHNA